MKKLLLIFLLVCSPVFAGVDFDGADDYVVGTDSFYSDAITVCAWVNPDVLDTNNRSIVFKRNGTDANQNANEWQLHATSTGTGFAAWQTGGSIAPCNPSGAAISTSSWSHVCATSEGNGGNCYVFVNGVAGAADAVGAATQDTTSTIQVGTRNANNDARYWNGRITEVAIWNARLTDDEIINLASSRMKRMPLQIKKDNLKIYLPMDHYADLDIVAEDTFYDLSGNGNNFTGKTPDINAVAEEALTYP